MGWMREDMPGCEGYIQAVRRVKKSSYLFEDVTENNYLEHFCKTLKPWPIYAPVTHIQVVCTCGWRSPHLLAPFGVRWAPSMTCLDHVSSSEEFETQCGMLWHGHLHTESQPARFLLSRWMVKS